MTGMGKTPGKNGAGTSAGITGIGEYPGENGARVTGKRETGIRRISRWDRDRGNRDRSILSGAGAFPGNRDRSIPRENRDRVGASSGKSDHEQEESGLEHSRGKLGLENRPGRGAGASPTSSLPGKGRSFPGNSCPEGRRRIRVPAPAHSHPFAPNSRAAGESQSREWGEGN